MIVDLYEMISKNCDGVYVSIGPEFKKNVIDAIKTEFGSLRKFQKQVLYDVKYGTLKAMFSRGLLFNVGLLFRICDLFGITQKDIFGNIMSFRLWGSHSITKIPRTLEITPEFVKGLALYNAEGDTGLSGKKIPAKVRFTSADAPMILFFRDWLVKYFKQDLNDILLYVYCPEDAVLENIKQDYCNTFGLQPTQIHVYHDKYVTVPKYRISLERKIILFCILFMLKNINKIIRDDYAMIKDYLKGMFMGEGSVYLKNSQKYVRLEMKNVKEVHFISSLLHVLDINHKVYMRSKRKGMWWIHIGRKEDILKFSNSIGFDLKEDRKEKLKEIINRFFHSHELCSKTFV